MSAPLLTYSAFIMDNDNLFFPFCQAGIAVCNLKVFVNNVERRRLKAANDVFQQLSATAAGLSARRAVDQSAVLPYHLYVAPVDDAVVLPPQQSEEPRPAVDDDGDQPRVAGVHLDVADIPQPRAVFDVDDLFVSQIHYPTIHSYHPCRPLAGSLRKKEKRAPRAAFSDIIILQPPEKMTAPGVVTDYLILFSIFDIDI